MPPTSTSAGYTPATSVNMDKATLSLRLHRTVLQPARFVWETLDSQHGRWRVFRVGADIIYRPPRPRALPLARHAKRRGAVHRLAGSILGLSFWGVFGLISIGVKTVLVENVIRDVKQPHGILVLTLIR